MMAQEVEERKIYSEREKLLLASFVDQYKDIIECKKTDSVNLRRKQDVWAKICTGYNSHDVTKRTTKQLKKLWDNLKQKTRKCDTDRKNAILKTGGGRLPPDDPDPLYERVRSIVPTIDLEIENCWDSVGSFKNNDLERDDLQDDMQTSKASLSCYEDHDYTEKQSETLKKDGPLREVSTKDHDWEEKKGTNNYSSVIERENIPCVSKKRKLTKKQPFSNSKAFNEEEGSLRIKKMEESIEQQRELHQLKMATARAEKEYWELKLGHLKNSAFSQI